MFEKIRGELDPLELGVDTGGEAGDRGGLGESRDAFDQDVAVGEHADHQAVEQVLLPDDHPVHLLLQEPEWAALHLDLPFEFGDLAGGHGASVRGGRRVGSGEAGHGDRRSREERPDGSCSPAAWTESLQPTRAIRVPASWGETGDRPCRPPLRRAVVEGSRGSSRPKELARTWIMRSCGECLNAASRRLGPVAESEVAIGIAAPCP
jgi:hypothetical protein